jgi:hypothetical protein
VLDQHSWSAAVDSCWFSWTIFASSFFIFDRIFASYWRRGYRTGSWLGQLYDSSPGDQLCAESLSLQELSYIFFLWNNGWCYACSFRKEQIITVLEKCLLRVQASRTKQPQQNMYNGRKAHLFANTVADLWLIGATW